MRHAHPNRLLALWIWRSRLSGRSRTRPWRRRRGDGGPYRRRSRGDARHGRVGRFAIACPYGRPRACDVTRAEDRRYPGGPAWGILPMLNRRSFLLASAATLALLPAARRAA